MPDREKVVNALECCIDGMLCAECGYEGIDRCFDKVLMADALALLKEQEKEIENLKEIIKKADYTLEIVKDKLNDLFKKTEGR